MPQNSNIINSTFGFLTVVRRAPNHKSGAAFWVCKCECGNVAERRSADLTNGRSTSCGCKKGGKITAKKIRHGHAIAGKYTPEYRTWAGMKYRCYNKKSKSYPDYGGRGITVCDRWIESFENFLSDMGLKPSRKYTIERVDNNDSYCPSNCRWIIKEKQARNRRSSLYYKYDGETLTMAEWAERKGINYQTLMSRYYRKQQLFK